MEISSFSKTLSEKLSHNKKDKMKNLLREKDKLERCLVTDPKESLFKKLKTIDDTINAFIIEQTASSIFRSKCLYAREGEKCTTYFLSLEKKRYLEKNMKCEVTEEGVISSNQNTILEEQTKFYKNLYASDESIQFRLMLGDGEHVLMEEQKTLCDLPFEPDEFFDAMMTLKPNKVPGLEGLPIEFYRKFWKVLSPELINMFQYCYDNGTLPRSVQQGLIS